MSCDGLLVKTVPYLDATLDNLESMRGSNGLPKDTISINTVLNPDTSPTNIGVDLMIQTELNNLKLIDQSLSTLSKLRFHRPTGLFFSRYSTDLDSSVTDFSVSAIDNLHLALALWTIGETYSNTDIGRKAAKLFQRMDFSVYLQENSGLIKGNLKYENGEWTVEEYAFSDLGSEARALYSLGFALNLFKSKKMDEILIKKSLHSTMAEIFSSREGVLLKLWDGSAFQLFFPKIFIGEERYSLMLSEIFKNTAKFMVSEGERRNLEIPAAHSAMRATISENKDRPSYQDKAGIKALISSRNQDRHDSQLARHWDTVFTPYALVMAATADQSLMTHLKKAEKLGQESWPLYSESRGWFDGYHLAGDMKGQVVTAQISLNQGMIALSLMQMNSPDGKSVSARALFKNQGVRSRLKRFYELLDEKFDKSKQ